MFGYLGALQAMKDASFFDATFFLAGVSGSCWTIASLYCIAKLSPYRLEQHYLRVAAEGLHPMSRSALERVARTSKGVEFLIAPLLTKLRHGNVGTGIMVRYLSWR